MFDGKQNTKCMLGRLSHPRHPKSALGGPAGYSSVQVSANSSAEAKALTARAIRSTQAIYESARDFTHWCVSMYTIIYIFISS